MKHTLIACVALVAPWSLLIGEPMRRRMQGLMAGTLLLLAAPCLRAENLFKPDFRINPDDYTVLMAADAKLSPGLARGADDHRKFPVGNWTTSEQLLAWDVRVAEAADYAVNVLMENTASAPVGLEVSCGASVVKVESKPSSWRRLPMEGVLPLAAGAQRLTLRAIPAAGMKEFRLSVMSIELVRPAVRAKLHQAALALRSDTGWFIRARYGIMAHWTSQSMPRQGERKPYAQAVQDFDVETVANQLADTGAGFFLLTTSHGEQYFPGPNRALDRILPGRTARRDLVGDLAEALNKRGMKLMLYYHLGAADAGEKEWLTASGFWGTDTSVFFDNWTSLIGEAGERYGARLAGWWFDDGTFNCYYRSAPWEKLARAAKRGNPQRLIAFNSAGLPSATEFQDFDCGECADNPAAHGWLTKGGDGRYVDGPNQGLQASANLTVDGGWVHGERDKEIGKPRWTPEELASLLRSFEEHKAVPIFNLEIYQEGGFSPASIELFKQARTLRRP